MTLLEVPDSLGSLVERERPVDCRRDLFSVRQGRVTLPELELPEDFDTEELQRWIEAIPSGRLPTMTANSLARLIRSAMPQAA